VRDPFESDAQEHGGGVEPIEPSAGVLRRLVLLDLLLAHAKTLRELLLGQPERHPGLDQRQGHLE
jgi:hypothetical protein